MSEITAIKVELGERSYPVLVGKGLVDHAAEHILSVVKPSHVMVLAQPTVAESVASKVVVGFEKAGLPVWLHVVPDGEKAKTFESVEKAIDRMLEVNMPRQGLVVTVGGGAVGDMGGFVASLHMRGIAFVQIPTTLLAMVDASVGGKTGINTSRGKNLVGTFWQPKMVIADLDTLQTLPEEQISAGMAEVIKHGVIEDAALFAALEAKGEELAEPSDELLTHSVQRSCEIKAAVVAEDERESGKRMILNFGHTFGHAVENLGGYHNLLHGECVSIGMVVAAEVAEALGLVDGEVPRRIEAVCTNANLPTEIPGMPWPRLLEVMRRDKKVSGSTLRFVLPTRLGEVTIHSDVPLDVVERVCRQRGAID